MRIREFDATFRKGHKKFRMLSERQLSLVLRRYAVKVLRQAVTHYWRAHGQSLTGNTVTGFSAGIYIKGVCAEIINVLDIDKRLDPPTSGYTKQGKYGFSDYDSDEEITKEFPVKPYHGNMNFQPTKVGGSSINDTARWLKDKKLPKDGIFIIVANVSPYVEWLHEVRGFEILDAVSEESYVKKGIMNEINRIRPIDVFDKGK